MEKVLQYMLTGLAAGSLYALVALGVVLIYRSTRVLNFAHGDIATLATFVSLSLLSKGYSFPLALTVSLIVGSAVSVAFYVGVLAKAQREGANLLGMVILTLGLALILQGAVVWWWGAEPVSLPFPISDTRTYKLGPVVVSQLSIATMAAGLVGSFLLYLLVQKTRLGLAMRATSENVMAAQTLGIPTRMVLSVSWGVASALGVVAGGFLAPGVVLGPVFSLGPLL